MTKVQIISGFLGAGKTTLIKKLLAEAYRGEKVVLIENEFGQVGIDSGFLEEAGIAVREMNSGCICCSLVGDFGVALGQVLEQYHPHRILIEPSGVGKLSDVVEAVRGAGSSQLVLDSAVTVADATKCRLYTKNFGEFYNNQIQHAGAILLSRTQDMTQDKLLAVIALLREQNPKAPILTTPWEDLESSQILAAMVGENSLEEELHALTLEVEDHAHHHHHGEDCGCGHDHHDHDHGHEHGHHHGEDCGHDHGHHHHHDEDCDCGHHHDHSHEHEHHHHHGEDCACGCGHDHDHHSAGEVFQSWGVETPKAFTRAGLEEILEALSREETYGLVLRAKGMVPCACGSWLYFDYVPGEVNLREGTPQITGRLCVIGAQLQEKAVAQLFGLS